MGCQRALVPPFTAPSLEQGCPAQRTQEGQAHQHLEVGSTIYDPCTFPVLSGLTVLQGTMGETAHLEASILKVSKDSVM